MSIFMIIGQFGCKSFATAEYFAKHLTTVVPSVKMKSQAFTENDFEIILAKMRTVLHCEHTGSPLIWRDLGKIGMCPTYIGGPSEFFDFCNEYYGVEMPCNPKQIDIIEEEYMKHHIRETTKEAKEKMNEISKRICITGAGNPAASLLLLELIQDKNLYTGAYLEIRLHDDCKGHKEKLESLIWDIEGVECPDICKRKVIICDRLYDAIKGCDLLLIMTEIQRNKDEILESYLKKNYDLMKDLAARIDEVEIVSLKTIITGINLLCFNTAVLLKYSKVLDSQKTIAVTSHVGLEALQYVANVSRLSASKVFGSPVWGYVGINQIVDTCHTKCLYSNWQIHKKPRKNPLKPHKPSLINYTELPVVVEKRDLCFRTHTCELMWQWIDSHRAVVKKTLGYFPYMSQVNATMHIIDMWLCSDYSKEIISAGILSDGSYGIPKGIVFSQPVTLEDGKWKIYKNQPVPHYIIALRYLFSLPLIISKRFNLADNLPSIEESFLPLKVTTPEQLNMIEQQKELQAKKALMLRNKGTRDDEDDDEKELLQKKQQMIEQLIQFRKDMKEVVKSNPQNGYTRMIEKMKLAMEEEAAKEAETEPVIKTETVKDDKDETEEPKSKSDSIEMSQLLEKHTVTELESEIENLDLIEDLGTVYGNKILSKYEKKVQPVEKKEKPKPQFLLEYRKICDAETNT